ncbi:MAG: HEAT repeat domain-containing protein, partial [Gemmataceae bacterium]
YQAPSQPAPYQAPAPTPQYQAPAPAPLPMQTSATTLAANTDVEYHLGMLRNQDERVRTDSVMQLGRSKSTRAVDPLAATLAGDQSPTVREAAARALGLLGSPQALPALQHAAQADADRDVRRSAQFAAEVIQNRN